jgi:hypothetical protein
MTRTIVVRLNALSTITQRLTEELRGQKRLVLKSKRLNGGPPRKYRGISKDGRLWLSFAKLQTTCDHLKKSSIQTMELNEREARFNSAILSRRLEGKEKEEALRSLELGDSPAYWVYEISPGSKETKIGRRSSW